MTLTADGWFSWMQRESGPADKTYSQPNTHRVFIPHSAVGYYAGWMSRLYSTAHNPDGRYTDFAAASVHIWIEKDGHAIQHYPITASCWASGSRTPNCSGVAAEHAGGAPGNETEPFTPEQVATDVRILRDLAAFNGVGVDYWRRPAGPSDLTASLYEHRECKRFGSDATACPSNRVPWPRILAALEVENDMTAEEKKELEDDRIALSLEAARKDTIAALATSKINARHVDNSKATVILIDPATGADLTAPLRVI